MPPIASALIWRRAGQAWRQISPPLARACEQLGRAGQRALDPWLPRTCALCGSPLAQPDAGLCGHCRLSLPGRQRLRCPRCGLAGGTLATPCTDCQREGLELDATCVLGDYAPPLDRLIGALKFQGQLSLAQALGHEMAVALRRWQASTVAAPIGLLVPVPLATERLRERGYNQAAAIARTLGRQTRIPVGAVLARSRATRAQSGLPMAARHANVRDAFSVPPGALPLPAHIALVDDVMTTGATLNAAAAALRRAGVGRITAVVAARTA